MAHAPRKLDAPIPSHPIVRIWDMLCHHFFQLLWANFLCSLCCIPIVTIPGALCGLYAVVQQFYRNGYGEVNRTFFRELKQDFLPRLLICGLLAALPVLGFALGGAFSGALNYVLSALFLVVTVLLYSWLFPQLALLKLRPWEALRNAAILTGLESLRNLCLMLVSVMVGAVYLFFWPASFLLFLFILPVAPVIAIHAITEPVLEARIINQS